MSKKLFTISVLVIALAALSSCGLKGPLNLPEDEQSEKVSHPSASY